VSLPRSEAQRVRGCDRRFDLDQLWIAKLRQLKPPVPIADKDGNGTAKLWERWNTLSAEAHKLKVPVPMLDPAAEPPDIIAAGKKLAADIEAAKNF